MKREKNRKAGYYQKTLHNRRGIPGQTTFPVEIVKLEDSSYHLIIKVEIDGIQGDMIIDTGASVTVVDQRLFAGKIGEENTVKMQSGSVTGQIEDVRLFRVQQFTIGNRHLKGIQLAAIDLEYVNNMYHHHLNRKIIGLLGCDFCVKYKAVIDYRTRELTLNFPR